MVAEARDYSGAAAHIAEETPWSGWPVEHPFLSKTRPFQSGWAQPFNLQQPVLLGLFFSWISSVMLSLRSPCELLYGLSREDCTGIEACTCMWQGPAPAQPLAAVSLGWEVAQGWYCEVLLALIPKIFLCQFTASAIFIEKWRISQHC